MAMVDKSRRSFIRKIGTLGGLAIAAGGGKVYWWDRRDDRIDPDGLEKAIEKRAAKREDGDTNGWEASIADLSQAEARLEHVGTTADGGDRYDAVLEAPLEDGNDTVCAHNGEPAALASTLETDAIDAFTALYNTGHQYAQTHQQGFEDAIEAYELRFTGEDGAATARFTDEEAVDIGGGALPFADPYGPEGKTSDGYQRFVEQYYQAFDVECDA